MQEKRDLARATGHASPQSSSDEDAQDDDQGGDGDDDERDDEGNPRDGKLARSLLSADVTSSSSSASSSYHVRTDAKDEESGSGLLPAAQKLFNLYKQTRGDSSAYDAERANANRALAKLQP